MKKLQEEFLKKLGNNNRLDLLLTESMGVYFFVKDTHGRVVMANRLTYERCGFKSEEESLVKPIMIFLNLIWQISIIKMNRKSSKMVKRFSIWLNCSKQRRYH